MFWVLAALAITASALLLWAVIDPRGQWRVLVGWSARDPAAAEPGGAVLAIQRLIAGLGVAGIMTVVGFQVADAINSRPEPPQEASALAKMWGTPVPRLVDRIINPATTPPESLVAGSVVAVQEITPGFAPAYVLAMPRWSLLGNPTPQGLIGAAPADTETGYGRASLLVSVTGPLMCIPRVAVVTETEDTVTIGVWFGLPDAPDGAAQDHVAGCVGSPVAKERVLLPLPLHEGLGDRHVVTVDGTRVPEVPVR